jgi:hypothetical protein
MCQDVTAETAWVEMKCIGTEENITFKMAQGIPVTEGTEGVIQIA